MTLIPLLEIGILHPEEKTAVLGVRSECSGLCKDHLGCHSLIIDFEHNEVFHQVPITRPDIDAAVGKLVHHLVSLEERAWIIRRDAEERVDHRKLGPWRDVGINPETDPDQEEGNGQDGHDDSREAHPVGTERDDFVVSREAAEDQQHGREESPRDREGHREREHEGNEREDRLQRHIVIDEQVEHLLEDVAQNQNEAQQSHSHGGGHTEGSQQITVENFQEIGKKMIPCHLSHQDKRKSNRVPFTTPDCNISTLATHSD